MTKMADNRSFVKSLSFCALLSILLLKYLRRLKDFLSIPALFALFGGGFDSG